MPRAHDIVLFGATGYIGGLVATILAGQRGQRLRWVLAGRSREKLEAKRRELSAIDGALADAPIEVIDAHDTKSLDALAANTRVVCTTVGPFAKHGAALVAACARHGTHYCDITGEIPFIRRSIDDNHEEAEKTRARIVHCCGFDSIPFDLGVQMLFEHAESTYGEKLAWVKGFTGKLRGGFGGGGAATMFEIVEQIENDRSVLRLLADPYSLDPNRGAPGKRGPDGGDQRGVRYDEDLGCWTAPWVMAGINTRIVRRSNALLGHAYGRDFRYHEAMSFRAGPMGLVSAAAVTAGLGAMLGAIAFRPTRRLLRDRVLPKPGEGPSLEARERGSYEVSFVGETERSGTRVVGAVEDKGDPACSGTAKMLAESALCLLEDGACLDERYGVLTPASAMGMTLVRRLRSAGVTFRVS